MGKMSRDFINIERLHQEMVDNDLDAVAVAAPENTFYLSGSEIRTQISIRERLAIVLWPRDGEPTFIVCNIEESLAKSQSWIEDLQIYVEFAESPIAKLKTVISERGLDGKRIGVETRYLSQDYYHELTSDGRVVAVAADRLLERVRAIKTRGERELITQAFLATEEAMREAWTASGAGDTERQVADRMISGIAARGADEVRHLSLNSGPNTVVTHRTPDSTVLKVGDLVTSDFGGTWSGFSSDIARVGIVGQASSEVAREYKVYRKAYVESLLGFKPGETAAQAFDRTVKVFHTHGMELPGPHVGHSLSRGGGHENPILHPFNEQIIETGMLIAFEPVWKASDDRLYHLEDMLLITESGCEVLTPWETHEEMIVLPR